MSIDRHYFREAFTKAMLTEMALPVRTVNEDHLRGFPANFNPDHAAKELLFVENHAERIADLYNRLADDYSRFSLVFLYLNRVLGGLHSQAPHVNPEFQRITDSIVNYTKGKDRRIFKHQWLARPIYVEEYELPVGGRTLKLDTHDISALEIFLLHEYDYNQQETITVKPGDVIIDAGACWGDTALYFAAKAAPGGHVYAFELSPDNMEVFNTNMAKNPDLAPMISLVQRPLASDSQTDLWLWDAGAASRIQPHDNGGIKMRSLSIDDFVKEQKIDRVDFIKFDIEGAERYALDGAVETIKRDEPTLAVSIYHLPDDPFVIAEKVTGICGNYKLYMKGVCKNYGETILFFKSSKR